MAYDCRNDLRVVAMVTGMTLTFVGLTRAYVAMATDYRYLILPEAEPAVIASQ